MNLSTSRSNRTISTAIERILKPRLGIACPTGFGLASWLVATTGWATPTQAPPGAPTPRADLSQATAQSAPRLLHYYHPAEERQADSASAGKADPEPQWRDEVELIAERRAHLSPDESLIALRQQSLLPQRSGGPLLRQAPGLVAVQHSGGGKAAQYFLRGFDVDHGTDLRILVDGVPVNMPSHGHGQGYADLHFVIPELYQTLTVQRGLEHAEHGDFATAGALQFDVGPQAPTSQLALEAGQYGRTRGLAISVHDLDRDSRVTLAGEAYVQDGPFENPERLRQINAYGRLTHALTPATDWSLTAMSYSGKWNASGQIPQRAVASGLIDRFGTLDPSEGGVTQRHSLSLGLNHRGAQSNISANLYVVDYRFGLYSNFTNYLRDPIQGDQIEQVDDRIVFGGSAQASHHQHFGDMVLQTRGGLDIRRDSIDNALHYDAQRRRLSTASSDTIALSALGFFLEETLQPRRWLSLRGAVRLDTLNVAVDNLNDEPAERQLRSGVAGAAQFSPKLSVSAEIAPPVSLYASWGRGFHSNDARGAVRADSPAQLMVPALGFEMGTRLRPVPQLELTLTAYHLDLDSEQVYVGDEGTTEASPASRRIGVESSLRCQCGPWLDLQASATLNRARFRQTDESEDQIPLAPRLTAFSRATFFAPWEGTSASLEWRYVGDRPATEDGSLTATGWSVLGAAVSHRYRQFEFSASVDNLLNATYSEVQFATESQLAGEAQPVSEIHFAPSWPRTVQLAVKAKLD